MNAEDLVSNISIECCCLSHSADSARARHRKAKHRRSKMAANLSGGSVVVGGSNMALAGSLTDG